MAITTQQAFKAPIKGNYLTEFNGSNHDVYAHFTDNGNGTHSVHGKVRHITATQEGNETKTTTSEVSIFQCLDANNAPVKIDSKNITLEVATQSVVGYLSRLNPGVEFTQSI